MPHPDFDVRLRREAKTSLAAYRDSSLLRRKFGEPAAKLYGLIDSNLTIAELIHKTGIGETQFFEILEFMNNNGMVSAAPSEKASSTGSGNREGRMESSKRALGADGKGGEGDDGSGASDDGDGEENEDDESGAGSKGGGYGSGRRKGASGGGGRGADADEDDESGAGEGELGANSSADDKGGAEDESEARPRVLSPLEKTIYEKYGNSGVRIYNMIDGEKTAEEILKETHVSEAKLVEILEFMDERGIIKLEKPADPSSGSGGEEEEKTDEEGEAKPAQEPRFKPMIEDEPEGKPFEPPRVEKKEAGEKPPEAAQEKISEDIIQVDVAHMEKISLAQRASMMVDMATKFSPKAKGLLNMIDGKRDFIDLSLATSLPLYEIDNIMAHFGKKGFMSFTQLGREEIKRKYGEDGFSIYKRWGRDGLLLYEMIGKEPSIKDIVLKSSVEPDRAIDILVFIHKVLGLDVPIDRDIIYRQMGLKK